MKKVLFVSMLVSTMSLYIQAQTSSPATGKWAVVDQTNEMGTRYKALMLVGVVVDDEDKGAILTLQKSGESDKWFFGIALTVPANRDRSVLIRFDQAEAQSHAWNRSDDNSSIAIMPADDLLERMSRAETFRLQYHNLSGGYITILRFDVRGFQAARNKLTLK
jgi:hypothetical protein